MGRLSDGAAAEGFEPLRYAPVTELSDLEAVYGAPVEASLVKVARHITPHYRRLLEASPFFTMASAGPEGLDCSPRGELGGGFVIADEKTLIIADRRGNNRIDTLRNIVRDPRVAFLFLIPGSSTTVRMNGTAVVTLDGDLLASLAQEGQVPRSAIIVTVDEIYVQCGRAVIRAGLWDAANHVDTTALPTIGEVLAAQKQNTVDSAPHDERLPKQIDQTISTVSV